MSPVVELLRSRSRALVLAAVAVGTAGCSADSTRLAEGPPRGAPNEVTGSVAPGPGTPVGRVEATGLPPPGGDEPSPSRSADTGVAGGSRGMASFNPAPTQQPEVTGTLPPPAA